MNTEALLPRVRVEDDAVVARHNNLIEAQFYASPQEQKLFLWAVSRVQAEAAAGAQTITVAIAELARFIGLDDTCNIYRQMVDVTDRISGRKIRIKNLETGEFVQSNLANARYRKGSGQVEIEISGFLMPYIVKLQKNFTAVELKTVMGLTSGHAMRLYDLVKSRLFRGHSIEVSLEDLQKIFGVTEHYQQRFNNFRTWVLEPACEEVTRGTELNVRFAAKPALGDKRRVGSIVFDVQKKSETWGSTAPAALQENSLVTRLVHAGLKKSEAIRAVESFAANDPSRITWHLDELSRKVARQEVKTPVAWLRAGLREDYRPQQSGLEREIAGRKTARGHAQAVQAAQAKTQDESAERKQAEIRKRLAVVVAGLGDGEREAWVIDVANRLKAEAMRNSFLKTADLLSPVYLNWVAAVARDRSGVDVLADAA